MADDNQPQCFDAFPYAERQNRRLWMNGREMPGWYPSLDQMLPMVLCRVLHVTHMNRPATFCRVLGHASSAGRTAVWMGGYQATLMMDQVGWPVFRVERIFIPPESERSLESLLELLLQDGQKIARLMGVRQFQVTLLEMEDDALPGFPAVCSPFGPLADSRLGEPLAVLGFTPMTELGYYRAAATHRGGGQTVEGRPYRGEGNDVSTYLQLWAEHCAKERSDIHYLIARLHPLDPLLQHRMESQDCLTRIRFIGDPENPTGLVSWYPDLYPQMLGGEATGPQVRLLLSEFDPGAVTSAKVLKCLAPRAEESGREDLLAAGLCWATDAAVAAHPRLEWIQVGPVSPTHRTLLNVLKGEGFEPFGRLRIMERHLSGFSD